MFFGSKFVLRYPIACKVMLYWVARCNTCPETGDLIIMDGTKRDTLCASILPHNPTSDIAKK